MSDRLARPASPEQSGSSQTELLTAIRAELRRVVRPEHFESWFQEVGIASVDGERVTLSAPSVFVRDWIRRNHLRELRQAVVTVTGNPRADVGLTLAHRLSEVFDEDAFDTSFGTSTSTPYQMTERCGADPRPNGHDEDQGLGTERESGAKPADVAEERRANGVVGGPRADAGDDWSRHSSFGPSSFLPSGAHGPAHSAPDVPAMSEPPSDPADRDPGGLEPLPEPPHDEPRLEAGRPAAFQRYVAEIGARYGWSMSSTELNQNYTFDQFVVGPCNRLAQAAALAAGTTPGRAYNPLFVHGNVGLGKTHLLQAICQTVLRKNRDARVLYMSCEDFTNRFIHCIQTGELDAFREYHRNIDVLVIDDVQFLANKDKTQDEFFHTFNALYNANRQIIISSDRPPSEIPTIEERLVSRFRWGLVAEMEVPCPETRVAIIKRKARLRRVEIPDDVAWFIAERIDTNIRELEGAVIKVVGVASITERPLSVELAEEALKGVVVSRTRKLTLSDVMSVVTAHFSVSARELTGKGRTRAVGLPRQICMYLCRQTPEQSLEEIGRFFGNRDHTTVIYAVQKIKKRVKEDRVFRELVNTLSVRLQG